MKKYAVFLVLLAGTCWGSIGIFVRLLGNYGIESMQIVEVRAVMGVLIIGIGIFFYDKNLFKINIRHLWCFIGTGVVGIVFFNLCYFVTIEATSLSIAAVLLYTAPIFVMLLSAILFKEKITKVKIIALILCVLGCAMVGGLFEGMTALSGKGLLIGLCSGLGYALYTIFNRYALNHGYNPLTVQFYTFACGVGAGALITDFSQINRAIVDHGGNVILVIVVVGFIATAVPNVAYTIGLKYIENGKASVIASMEPVTAIVFGMIVFQEIPSFIAAIGMIVALVGIIFVNVEPKKTLRD